MIFSKIILFHLKATFPRSLKMKKDFNTAPNKIKKEQMIQPFCALSNAYFQNRGSMWTLIYLYCFNTTQKCLFTKSDGQCPRELQPLWQLLRIWRESRQTRDLPPVPRIEMLSMQLLINYVSPYVLRTDLFQIS